MVTAEEYARFEQLSQQDVADLLRTHEVGRIAWNSAEGPVILPVAYAFARGALAFRMAAKGLLAESADPVDAPFEVDEFDVETATGWSVLVRAISTRVTEPREAADWIRRLPTPWAPGPARRGHPAGSGSPDRPDDRPGLIACPGRKSHRFGITIDIDRVPQG